MRKVSKRTKAKIEVVLSIRFLWHELRVGSAVQENTQEETISRDFKAAPRTGWLGNVEAVGQNSVMLSFVSSSSLKSVDHQPAITNNKI